MNRQETINEIGYIIERNPPAHIKAILLVLKGALLVGDEMGFYDFAIEFAKRAVSAAHN